MAGVTTDHDDQIKHTMLILETDRLFLREFSLDDTAFIIELLNSPGWIKYIGDRNVRTPEEAIAYLERGPLTSYKENGFGLYLVGIKESNTPIGMCGILKRDTLEKPDIGFAFLPEYHGKGYAFEIAGATIKYAKEKLLMPTIWAITVTYNQPSIKLLERIGLTFEKNIWLPDDPEELLLYST